jgi:hypothetical protein
MLQLAFTAAGMRAGQEPLLASVETELGLARVGCMSFHGRVMTWRSRRRRLVSAVLLPEARMRLRTRCAG